MQKLISEYLDQVTGGIRSQKRQRAVRAELAGHFAETIDKLMRDGLPEEDAARQAVVRMGSTQEVREKLGRANRHFTELLIPALCAGLGLLIFFHLIIPGDAGLLFDLNCFFITAGIGSAFALLGGVRGLTPALFFKRLTVTSLYGGGIGFLTGLILIAHHISDPAALGPGLSVALLCPLYALILSGVSFGLKTLLPALEPKTARALLQLSTD